MSQGTLAVGADADPGTFNFDKTQAKIKELSRQIKTGPVSPQDLENARQQAEHFAKSATSCITTLTEQIGQLDQEITSLGPAAEQEPVDIVKERKSLTSKRQDLQGNLSECRLTATLVTRLQNELANRNKTLQKTTLFTKNQNFFNRTAGSLPISADFNRQVVQFLRDQSGLQDLTVLEILTLLLLAVTGMISGLKLYRLLHLRLNSHRENQAEDVPLVGHWTMPAIFSSLISGLYLLYVHQDSNQGEYCPWLLFSLCLYFSAIFLFHLRNRLKQQAVPGSVVTEPLVRFRTLTFFCVLLFFSLHLDLNDFSALQSPLALLQSTVISGICLSGWWFLRAFGLPARLLRFEKTIRIGVSFPAVLVIFIELSGYRNLSVFLLVGFFTTFLLANLLRLALFAIDEIIGGFFTGKYRWQHKTRLWLGLSPQENLTGIMWVRLIFKLLSWSYALFVFLQLWGLPDVQRRQIIAYMVDGVSFAGLNIAPARIVLGCFVFACVWALIAWIKMQLEKKWLQESYFSQGAKETLVTMTGYAGFALALVVGLSIAGVSFSNLAVIAGALSVGIGFGLQNIVNNFVSGLIILFERPVKRGDWISVGKTEGYVQKISVRSTVIQTFDRSDVIVPNSELISNQVTNMMLNDKYGRLIIPIGVAYGSDTDLVRTTLLDIAKNNAHVINDGSAPEPQVLFLEFGESSLNFELRCHLTNINERLKVKSEINYQIDHAFRENNISMPFPQRDLYIKEFPFSENPARGNSLSD